MTEHLNLSITRAADLLWRALQQPEAGSNAGQPPPQSNQDARTLLGLDHPVFVKPDRRPAFLSNVGVTFLQGVTEQFGKSWADASGTWTCFEPLGTANSQGEQRFVLFQFKDEPSLLVEVWMDCPEPDGETHDCQATLAFFAIEPGQYDAAKTYAELKCDEFAIGVMSERIARLRRPESLVALRQQLDHRAKCLSACD